jgi:uncharacterized membrane protein YphA (DoxX/SURF4 family)
MAAAGIDPAVAIALRSALALLFLVAASHKLRDLPRFREAFSAYEVLPRAVLSAAAPMVPALEGALAVALGFGIATPVAAVAAAALMLAYASAIAANLARGRAGIDCGCMGPAARAPLSPWLVARNLVVAAAAVVVALPVAARGLSWLDIVAAAAATATLASCWAATGRMLALAPRVAAVRPRRPS